MVSSHTISPTRLRSVPEPSRCASNSIRLRDRSAQVWSLSAAMEALLCLYSGMIGVVDPAQGANDANGAWAAGTLLGQAAEAGFPVSNLVSRDPMVLLGA